MNNQNEKNSVQDECRNKYSHILNSLFSISSEKRSFDTLCTLLRVGGIENYYNAFEESKIAFNDFNWMLSKAKNERSLSCFRRIGLLMYCQAVEMTVPQIVLANLLHCVLGKGYVIDPFSDLYIVKKNKKQKLRIKKYMSPPSATRKFRKIKEMALEAGQTDLGNSIDLIFNEDVRNSFSHSDYVLTDSHFNGMEIKNLDSLFCECFGFYEAFFAIYRNWIMSFGIKHRYFKWPNYEVLELIRTDKEGLIGFNLHYSNGNKSSYKRSRSGVDAINIGFDENGRIEFMVGSKDDLCPVWKIDGKPIDTEILV